MKIKSKEKLAIKLIDLEIITPYTKIIRNHEIQALGINPRIPNTYAIIKMQPQTLMREWRKLGEDFWIAGNHGFWAWYRKNIITETSHKKFTAWQFKGLDSQGRKNYTEYTLHPKFYLWLNGYVKEIKRKHKEISAG